MQEINQNNRTNEEIYAGIVSKIKTMYHDEITELEAKEAARNLIGLCQEIFDYKMEKAEKQRSLKKKVEEGEKKLQLKHG